MPHPMPSARRRITVAATVFALAVTAALTLLLAGEGDTPGRKDGPSSAVSTPGAEVDGPSSEGPDLSHLARRDADDPMAVGKADAPVVLIEYADFQCPFCGKFARETEPELLRAYVEKGVLRIEWRNFPVFGQESEQSALAAWAAGRQDRFREFHKLLYAEDRARNSGVFTEDNLVDFARDAGVPDLEKFRDDMNSQAAREALQVDKEEGYRLGVSSTPAFLINNTPILGAMPTPTFEKAIEEAAREAKQ